MAKLEKTIAGDFNSILHRIEDGIINGSVSASLEDTLPFMIPSSILRNMLSKSPVMFFSNFAIITPPLMRFLCF